MIQPASTASPPQLRVALTNDGPGTVTVEYGAALVWSVDASYPDVLQLIPATQVGQNPTATPNARCWAYPAPVPIPAMATVDPLAPDERLVQSFAVYNRENACYPPGDYPVRDEIEIEGISGPVELTVTITIGESGRVGVEASPTAIVA